MKLQMKQMLVGILTGCLVLTGCSSGGSKNIIGLSSTTVTGKVTSVDGKKVLITLGVLQKRGGGGGPVPEKPDTPSDGMGQDQTFISGDTEAEFTISDESAIFVEEGIRSDETPGKQDSSGGTTKQGGLNDIIKDSIIAIELDKDGAITKLTVLNVQSFGGSNDRQPEGSAPSGVNNYTAVNTYNSDTTIEGDTLTSNGADENVALVDEGATVTFHDTTITRTSSDSTGGDASSFYGVGAALLTTEGTSYVKGGTISTDSAGGAGLFAYGKGVVYAADTSITTKQNTSGGIHAAGGGTLYAWNLTSSTDGESSATIRSDRGGGTMVVDGGTYISNGVGSPTIYCTADISVNNSNLVANGSEGICIEGLNTLRLFDSHLTSTMSDNNQNDTTWSVILYQSMSGDSEVGNSTFEMNGGSLTSKNGGLFYTTNTECTMTLKDVKITQAKDSEFFLQCTGNNNKRGWGTPGSNGSQCLFTGISQEMKGDVIWDSISGLNFYMTEDSTLTGAVKNDESYAGNGGNGYCNVYVSKDSKWVVTGDSTLTNLNNQGTIVDIEGNAVKIIGMDGTVYQEGNSMFTVTVKAYRTSVELSKASTISNWSDYAVEKPELLQ